MHGILLAFFLHQLHCFFVCSSSGLLRNDSPLWKPLAEAMFCIIRCAMLLTTQYTVLCTAACRLPYECQWLSPSMSSLFASHSTMVSYVLCLVMGARGDSVQSEGSYGQ